MPLPPDEIIARLSDLYGMPRWVPHHDPVSELVLTILSQNTSDTNSGRAFNRLRQRFDSWDDVLEAPTEDIIEAIRPGGLAETKGPRIQRVLALVKEEAPDWDLSFLGDLPVSESRAWLMALPGVGPKTAACVLLFSMGRPALPVDTHVERVAKRLGLVPANVTAARAHDLLEDYVDIDDYYEFHVLLIKHGRRLCTARNPACLQCPLLPDCPWGQDYAGSRSGSGREVASD